MAVNTFVFEVYLRFQSGWVVFLGILPWILLTNCLKCCGFCLEKLCVFVTLKTAISEFVFKYLKLNLHFRELFSFLRDCCQFSGKVFNYPVLSRVFFLQHCNLGFALGVIAAEIVFCCRRKLFQVLRFKFSASEVERLKGCWVLFVYLLGHVEGESSSHWSIYSFINSQVFFFILLLRHVFNSQWLSVSFDWLDRRL